MQDLSPSEVIFWFTANNYNKKTLYNMVGQMRGIPIEILGWCKIHTKQPLNTICGYDLYSFLFAADDIKIFVD